MRRLAALSALLLLALGAWLALRPDPAPEDSPEAAAEPSGPDRPAGAEPRPRRARAAAPDAGPEVALAGLVLDRGQPAPGAELLLDGKPAARTDAEGRFHLRAALPCTLGARREGRSAPPRELKAPPAAELVLTLRAEGALAGTVRDAATGRPVAGAEVALEPGARKATTDAAGRFELAGLPDLAPPEAAHLVFTAAGYAHDYEDVPVPGGERVELSVVLEPGGPLSGRVLGKDGVGLEGVPVWARSPDDHGVYDRTQSGPGGRYRFDALPRSGTLLRTYAPRELGYANLARLAAVPGELDLVLPRGGELGGRVLDPAGRPVAGARVRLSPQGLTLAPPASAESDEAGRYDLPGLAPGRYQAWASAPGWAPGRSADVALREEAYQALDLRVGGGGAEAAGVVVDARSGQPLAGARVAGSEDDEAWARTGPDGHFALHGLGPEARVRAEAEGHRPAEAPAGPELRLALEPEPGVRGRAVDAEGAPLDAFEVDGEPVRAPDGRFTAHPHPGAGELRLSRAGLQDAAVPLPEGWADGLDVGDVVLRPAGAARLRVVDAQGRPVAAAAVFLTHGEGLPLNKLLAGSAEQVGVSDEQGRVRAQVSPGDYCFRALHPRLAPSGTEGCPHRVTEAGGEFTITLRPGAWVSGHVYRGGKAAPGVLVGDHQEGLSAATDPGGAYRIGPYPPGRLELLAFDLGAGADIQSASVDLVEGGEATADFGEQGSAALEVVVTGASAGEVLVALIPGADVDPERLSGPMPGGTRMQEAVPKEGAARARFEGLRDGPYLVVVAPRHGQRAFRQVTAATGTVARVEIGLGP